MQQYPQIKRLVQQTLGCSCPEEVFQTIDCVNEDDGLGGMKITVGNRLLIYIIRAEETSGLHSAVNEAMQQGVGERDENGLNRFRLVLVTSRQDELSGAAEGAFAGSGYVDERTHLHIIGPADVAGL